MKKHKALTYLKTRSLRGAVHPEIIKITEIFYSCNLSCADQLLHSDALHEIYSLLLSATLFNKSESIFSSTAQDTE